MPGPRFHSKIARKMKADLYESQVLHKPASEQADSPDYDEPKLDPRTVNKNNILQLQHTLGNQAVARMMQDQKADPVIQRVLLHQADWRTSTADYSRKKSPTLLRLDTLINHYNASYNLDDQVPILEEIQQVADEWLLKHNIQSAFNKGMAQRIRGLKHESANELNEIEDLNQQYQAMVGRDLPTNRVNKARAAELVQRFRAVDTYGYAIGQWAFHLLERVDAQKLTSPQAKMDALFDEFIGTLSGGFKYNSAGNPSLLDNGAQGNCQNLSAALMVLGLGLGLTVTTEVVSNEDFASAANSKFISPHQGNVRFEGQSDYTSKRFIFSMHVAAKFNGIYYDPTTKSKYGSAGDAVAWSLKNSGNTREFVGVKDGAKFPDGTPLGPATAEIVLDPTTTSTEFGYYWIIRHKDVS